MPLRAIYLTPHHQFPTTVTLSATRRLRLIDFAQRARVAILEDDYDHEFHYEGRPVAPLASAIGRAPVGLGNLAWALDLALADTREVAIAGDAEAEDTRTMVRAVLDRWNPWRVLAWGEADGVPLLDGRPAVGGHATAYVCRNFVCSAPVTDPGALRPLLEAAHG